MAIAQLSASRLRLVYYVGDDPTSGKPLYVNKNFNQVKTDATPEQLFAVAVAVAELNEHPLYKVERFDTSEIFDE